MSHSNGINDQADTDISEFDEQYIDAAEDSDVEHEEELPEPQLDQDRIKDDGPDEEEEEQYVVEGPYKDSLISQWKSADKPKVFRKALISVGGVGVAGMILYLVSSYDFSSTEDAETDVVVEESDWNPSEWDDFESSNPGRPELNASSTMPVVDRSADYEVELQAINELIEAQSTQLNELGRGLAQTNRQLVRVSEHVGSTSTEQSVEQGEVERETLQALQALTRRLRDAESRLDESEEAVQAFRAQEARRRQVVSSVPALTGADIQIRSVTEGFAIMSRTADGSEFTLKVGEGLRGWGEVTRITALGCIHIGTRKVEPVGGECR